MLELWRHWSQVDDADTMTDVTDKKPSAAAVAAAAAAADPAPAAAQPAAEPAASQAAEGDDGTPRNPAPTPSDSGEEIIKNDMMKDRPDTIDG